MAKISRIIKEFRLKKLISAFKVIRLLKNWPSYFKEFFGKSREKETVYKFRDGHVLFLKEHPLNTRIFNEIWVYECYNPKGFKIKDTDVVLDIGANYGNFTLYAALKASRGKVIAFEPLKENYHILEKNMEVNKLENVKLVMKAVSDKNGEKSFFLANKDNVSHSFFRENVSDIEEEIKEIKVKTTTLKKVLREEKVKKIDLLKMDCEGAEYEIILSIKDLLKNVEKISMEVHYIDEKRNVIELKRFLEKNNFIVNIDPPHETKFINLLFARQSS